MHGARRVDYRKAIKRLGRHDGLFQWDKGYQQSKILSAQQWRQVPAQITVRLLRFDAVIRRRKKRVTLVTTLLDPVAYPAHQLIGLYARRWHLELALRHLKTTLGMELKCLNCPSFHTTASQSNATACIADSLFTLSAFCLPCRSALAAAGAFVRGKSFLFAFPSKRGNMECLRRSRACSLTQGGLPARLQDPRETSGEHARLARAGRRPRRLVPAVADKGRPGRQ
jgi:hypothetical protein